MPHTAIKNKPPGKDLSTGCKMMNAKVETITEKPAFKPAFRKHKCLVVAHGFYELKRT
jgi:putative SOS response-associated peptidase YedK